jgi:hypothetical protein
MQLICMLIFAVIALPAWAETDYLCLNQCKRAGNASVECMQQCDLTPEKTKKSTHTTDEKKEFSPLIQGTAKQRPSAPTAPIKKDYTCKAQCLKDGMQYAFCEKKCILVRR